MCVLSHSEHIITDKTPQEKLKNSGFILIHEVAPIFLHGSSSPAQTHHSAEEDGVEQSRHGRDSGYDGGADLTCC